jgi:type IV pilus assembly protein PilN
MIRVNLLPREEKPSREAVTWGRVFVWSLIGAVIIGAVGIGLHIFRTYEIATLKSDIAETKAEQEKYREQAELVNQLTERRRMINERIGVVETLDKNRFLRVHLMDEVARSVPDYVWLESLQEGPGNVTLRGVAFSNLAISRFMDSLEEKAHVDSVFLRVIRKDVIEGTPVLDFELGYQVHPEGREGVES